MKIELASKYGFCYGVKRAIEIAEKHQNSFTYGPLIHNKDEINRLKEGFNIGLVEKIEDIKNDNAVVIRTHGIPKDELAVLKEQENQIIDATCPYVTTPQNIVKRMSAEGYSIVIFGDKAHPEIKGVVSYAEKQNDAFIVLDKEELEDKIDELSLKYDVDNVEIKDASMKPKKSDIDVEELSLVWVV